MYIDRLNSIFGVDWVDLKLIGLVIIFIIVLKKELNLVLIVFLDWVILILI